MRRKTFDALATTAGLVIATILLVAGGLLAWGHAFIDNQVTTQLTAQKIFFPANNSPAIAAPQFAAMHQYAGEQMTNGAQAEVWADHFMAIHLQKIGQGQTYAQVSAASLKDPGNAKLAAQADTIFKGETLRSMLLNAYGFWKMGQIMALSAIAAFIAAGILLVLCGLGLRHLRRTSPEEEVFPGLAATRTAATVA